MEGPWTVIAGVVAVVGVVLWVVGYRRQFPKRQIEWTQTSIRMVIAARSRVEVLVDGAAVTDPWATTITMASRSRRDIASDDFDAGRPIVFAVEAGSSFLPLEASGAIGVGLDEKARSYSIDPMLVHPGDSCRISFVTSGRPTVTASSPLVDIPLRGPLDGRTWATATAEGRRAAIIGFTTTGLLVIGLVLMIALTR